MRKIAVLALMLIGAATATSIYLALVTRERPPEQEPTTITIAAFNIQVLGKSKRQNVDVMRVLANIAREFDVVLIQEVRDSSEETIPYFLNEINTIGEPKYEFVRSERLGRTASKEAYAYLYNTETVDFIEGSDYVFNDVDDLFEREPFVCSFQSSNFDFTLVGIHAKPDDASWEIGNLTNVVSAVLLMNTVEKDITVLGDFNADGSYFNENDLSNPFRSSEYHWVTTNNMDTMTKTDYTYDRMVLMNATYSYEYIEESAAVFHFDVEYGITNATLVEAISDHYPIYAEFKTHLPDDD